MAKFNCEYCETEATSIQNLTESFCLRHPSGQNKGKHKLYEGSEKFLNDLTFYEQFSKIDNIKYYPYVGLNFKNEENRILIFAHNIYCSSSKFEEELERTKSSTHFSDALDEYVYVQAKWTTAFRNFVKGSLAIKENYTIKSNVETREKINNFISKISFTNYINDLVKSETANNVTIDPKLLKVSSEINAKLLLILDATHIICWGKNVFNYIILLDGVKILERHNLKNINGLVSRSGFEYSKIELKGKEIHILKTFHPSMPSFGHKNDNTHNIFNWFYKLR